MIPIKTLESIVTKLYIECTRNCPSSLKRINPKECNLREWRPVTTIDDKAKYEGDWDVETNERDGHGIQVFSDGSMYDGAFKQGLAHGKGRLIHAEGDVYEGQWAEGKA